MPGRWGGADEVRRATVVAELEGVARELGVAALAGTGGSSATSAGMSATAQCQNPDPVGVSGSKTVTT